MTPSQAWYNGASVNGLTAGSGLCTLRAREAGGGDVWADGTPARLAGQGLEESQRKMRYWIREGHFIRSAHPGGPSPGWMLLRHSST